MLDKNKTKAQLIGELNTLRLRVKELESLAPAEQQAAPAKPDSEGHFALAQQEIENLRQTELALRESEERFRRVISSISDHVYMTQMTTDGNQVNGYISPNIEELTGYPVEKLMNNWDFWRSLIHPEDIGAADAQVYRFTREMNSETEYRLKRADGEIIWVRDSAQIERSRDNKRLTVYGVVSDITDRKLAETLLQDYNRQLQQDVAERTRRLAKKNRQLEQEIAERKQIENALHQREARLRDLIKQAQTALILTEEQARRLMLLNEMSQKINLAVSETKVLKVAAPFTPKIIQADWSGVALLTEEENRLEVFTLEKETGTIPIGTRLSLDGTMVGK